MDTLLQDLKFAIRLLFKDRAFAATTHPDARALHRRQHRHLHGRPVRAAPALTVPGSRSARVRVRRLPWRRRGAGGHLGAELLRPAGDDRCARVAGALPVQRLQGRERARAPKGVPSMDVTPSFFRVLRAQAVRGRLFAEDDGQVGHNHVVAPQPRVRRQATGRHRRAWSAGTFA